MPTVPKPEKECWKRPEETGAKTGHDHDAEEEKAKSKDGQCSMAHLKKMQTVPGSSAPTSPLSPGGSGGLPSDSLANG